MQIHILLNNPLVWGSTYKWLTLIVMAMDEAIKREGDALTMSISKSKMDGEQIDNGAPLHGDVLEEIISHIFSLDLVPASHVSKSWRSAVASSLRRSSRRRLPWLILHLESRRCVTILAYDPQSSSWISILPSAALPAASFRSSHPGLLHALSPTELAFSIDAFGATWRRLRGPELWREDAVVARVGSTLIVAGGTCDFEGDTFAVESCNVNLGTWEACEPMPEAFKGSASATWLSVAAGERELHVLEKREGLLCSLHTETKRWGPVYQLSLQPDVFVTAIGLAGERLILVGAAGEATDVVSIKVWDVRRELGGGVELREITEMPAEMVGRLVGDGWGLCSSIGFSVVRDMGYLYNPSELGEVFVCELTEMTCRWASAGRPGDQDATQRVVFGCATVGMEELRELFGRARGVHH